MEEIRTHLLAEDKPVRGHGAVCMLLTDGDVRKIWAAS
jgi:hypothetical protein